MPPLEELSGGESVQLQNIFISASFFSRYSRAVTMPRDRMRVSAFELLGVVITAALPTAQNIFVTASRYEHGVVIAKDTVLMTTICAIPLMMALALLLGI